MINIAILNNFPKDVMDEFKNLYELRFKGKDPDQVWSKLHSASSVPRDVLKHINKLLPLETHSIDLYFVMPNGRMHPHIDRGRKTAFQIPIEIDLQNSYTYSLKGRDVSVLTPAADRKFSREINHSINQPEHWFFDWEDDLFDQYNLERPILQNASMPHGGANFGNSPRIFFSASYIQEFDNVVEIYKNWL